MMKIAPKRDGSGDWTDEDYKRLKFENESDWQTAIQIFEDRIRGRFLDVVNMIEHYTYAGFAVMALDCLLIETLVQFFHGEKETPWKKGEDYFVEFLTETDFKEYFNKDMAEKFYQHIRCGILHQAETKGESRITIKKNSPLVQRIENGDGIIIHRKKFHQKLVEVFEDYLEKLRNSDNKELRENFKKKMDFICHVHR